MNATQNPLSIYRISKKGVSGSVNKKDAFDYDYEGEKNNEQINNPLEQYRINPPEKMQKYGLKDIFRVGGGLGARSLEIAAGTPGNIQNFAGFILDKVVGAPLEFVTGKEHPKIRHGLKSAFKTLPSSEEIKESVTKSISEKILGNKEALEPKNEPERFAQEFTQDLVSLALPGSGVTSTLGKVGLALAGNSAKEVAKQYGFSPSTQEWIKFGTLGVISLANIGNAPKYASQLFEDVKSQMGRGVRFNTNSLKNEINKIKQSSWYKGHTTPSTAAAREMIDAIEKRIKNSTMSAQEAMQLRENINEMRGNLGAYKVEGTGKSSHVSKLNDVQNALITGMEQTLGQTHPSWWKQYQNANQAYAITKSSSAVGNFIANNYGKPILSDAGKILFGNAVAKGAAGVAKLGVAGAGIATGAKAISIVNRVWKSPVLRRYYKDVVNSSLRSDSLAMMNSLEKFDKESLKEQEQERAKNVLRGPRQK